MWMKKTKEGNQLTQVYLYIYMDIKTAAEMVM